MANTQNANKWHDRLNKGKRWQRLAWNVAYRIGRAFSFGRWNPLKNFSPQSLQRTTTRVLAKDLNKEKPIAAELLPFDPSPLESFPDEILLEIQKSLDLQSVARLAQTNKNLNALFQPEIVQPENIKKLLQYVAYGQQAEAEEILKKYPKILLKKATVTDYSGRTFENITAFQYALWARDRDMWVMLMKYLSDEEALYQLNQLESKSTEHGKFFDLNSLIQAMQRQVDFCTVFIYKFSHEKNLKLLLTIGECQRDVPAHVAQYYCDPNISFSERNNHENISINRSLFLKIWFDTKTESKESSWYPLGSSYQLGINAIVIRHYYNNALKNIISERFYDVSPTEMKTDLIAITNYNEFLNKEYNELKSRLNSEKRLSIKN